MAYVISHIQIFIKHDPKPTGVHHDCAVTEPAVVLLPGEWSVQRDGWHASVWLEWTLDYGHDQSTRQ